MSDEIFHDYGSFARALYETGILSDAWYDGAERFSLRGVVLTRRMANELQRAAERVAYLHQELVEILLENPALVEMFYRLTPYQSAMWEAAGGAWHGMARADLFITENGAAQCCELNSDTPSGQPEAVLLNQLLRAAHGRVSDPNERIRARFISMLRESHAKRTSEPLASVAIIYPTELTEDLGMITLFSRWLAAEGIKTVCGSPFNIRRAENGVEVLGSKVDLIYRHYKTDWWSERVRVWGDQEEFADAEPLREPLAALIDAETKGEATVVNPFGAVLTQNKFSLAFFWEEQARFSKRARGWIRRYLPETVRLQTIGKKRLLEEKDLWVLKSDYGCEGRETVCGAFVNDEEWRRAVSCALPEHFVAQKFFRAARDEQGMMANYGVYLFGGAACGFFTRLSRESTTYASLTAPTFTAGN
jgi:glutathionylspermidine synthase